MQHGLCTDCTRYDSRITQLNGKNKDTCKKCKWLNCGVGGDYWNEKEEGKAMFKVGDRVRVIGETIWAEQGDIGTVDENGSQYPFVKFDNGKRHAIYNDRLELINATPRINTTARDDVAASLRECAGNYAQRFEVAIEAIEQADRPEVVMQAKKVLLKSLVGELPLNTSSCYFCQAHGASCAACEYPAHHGKCGAEESDYTKIATERTHLLQAIASYYNGESYDTEHAEYMRLKAKFEG